MIFLTGCSSTAERNAYLTESNRNQTALANQLISQGTLTVDCPSGCNVKYTDPQLVANVINDLKPQEETNGWDVGLKLTDGLFSSINSLGLPLIGMSLLKDVISNESGDTITNTSINTDSSNNSTTTSIDGSFNRETNQSLDIEDSFNRTRTDTNTETTTTTYPISNN